MSLRTSFIQATREYNTFENPVPAYYFRKNLCVEESATATVRIAVCGFYDLYFNGQRLTRGLLSPYISNPEDLVYYDEYQVTLTAGENVFGVLLGNGFQNNPGGYIWDFDKASFRSAPKFALTVTDGAENTLLESGEDFRTTPSPIVSDDYRFGESYDATREIPGWNLPGFDDSAWGHALTAEAPTGDIRRVDVAPITKEREIPPVSVTKCGDGYLYDFGEINAGLCRLKVTGKAGQRIQLRHADDLKDGDLRLDAVWFHREEHLWQRDRFIVHCDTYVCKGEGEEIYEPTFTYHGFRYVRVDGITEEQATPDLLTYLVYHTDLRTRGDFTCSDEVVNRIQKITRQSILSNFHHFPTDCPQREKNGWTADAALSAEAALANFDPERNYREWMRNICKAQSEQGSLPGIVPTGGWGFQWGNGPAWDCVLVILPYLTYIYRGETAMIEESADAFMNYLRYLRTRVDEQGLMHIGLGDWCHTEVKKPMSPLEVTDTIMSMDISAKMAFLLDAIGRTEDAAFARAESALYRAAIREHLIDFETMTVRGDCQTSQAMALYYGVFDADEEQKALARLIEFIHECGDRMDLGVLGGRVIFHVLEKYGYVDLAWRMIVEVGYPSYGDCSRRGATTLWESFFPEGAHWCPSLNHHFWGDVSSWLIRNVAGLRVNPTRQDANRVEIKPAFIQSLDFASAYYELPAGQVSVGWSREVGEEIRLTVALPEGASGTITLREGCRFEDGSTEKTAQSGTYRVFVGSMA